MKEYAIHIHVTCTWIQITISYASRYHILLPWIDKYLCISFCNGNERPRAREMPIICGLQIPIGCVTLVSIKPTIVSICYGHLNSASLQNTCIWYRYHFQLGIPTPCQGRSYLWGLPCEAGASIHACLIFCSGAKRYSN